MRLSRLLLLLAIAGCGSTASAGPSTDVDAAGRAVDGGGGSIADGNLPADGGGSSGYEAGSSGYEAGPLDSGAASGSTLPVPPGSSNIPRPSGGSANLKVLPWAGWKAAVTYSFDDTQPSHIDYFAQIKATGIPVTYYVTIVNDWYANWAATWKAALADGDELGNHTVHHCAYNLTNCTNPLATPADEIDQCTTYIETQLGGPAPVTAAYPYGDTGYEADAKSRFFLARGLGASGSTVMPGDASDPFNLPSTVVAAGDTATTFDGEIDSAHGAGAWLIFTFHSLLPDANNWYAGVNAADVVTSIGHAKSAADIWIDTVANVGAYWLGQKILQAVTPAASGSKLTWTWALPAHFPAHRYLRVTVGGGTLSQSQGPLPWNGHGYYEVALDDGSLTWTP